MSKFLKCQDEIYISKDKIVLIRLHAANFNIIVICTKDGEYLYGPPYKSKEEAKVALENLIKEFND